MRHRIIVSSGPLKISSKFHLSVFIVGT